MSSACRPVPCSLYETLTVSPLWIRSVTGIFPPFGAAFVPMPLPTTFVFESITYVWVKVLPPPLEPLIVSDVGETVVTVPFDVFDGTPPDPGDDTCWINVAWSAPPRS